MEIKKLNLNKKNNVSFLHYFIFAPILIVFFIVLYFYTLPVATVIASSSIGSIDLVNKYAYGEEHKEVKINFGFFSGTNAIVITDTSLSGYAWGENIGWINLFPGGAGVINNGEGILSGYASSELGGWINFTGVKINSSGDFLGYADTEKLGRIIFNCITNNTCSINNFKVSTDWRPVSVRKNTAPVPIYTIPIATVPPVFTSDSIPDKEIVITKKNDTVKPQPVGDISQYKGGGDVTKENKTINSDGAITTIILPNNTDTNLNTTSISKELGDSSNTKTLDTNIIINVVKTAEDISDLVQKSTNQFKKDANVITQTKAVDISTKTVTTIGFAGGGTAIVSSLTGSLISFSEFFLTFFRLWSIFLSALGLRKRREPWGTVYDSITKQPLDPAYVILQDNVGKEVATSITDLDGRYGFLVPPGKYRMVAKKTNYIAPSLHLYAKERDELYDNLYFGEEIELGNNKTITKNIPMDPQGFDWNEFAKRDKNIMKFHSPRQKLVAKISGALFDVGLLFAIGLTIIKPDIYNISILILYIVLFILRFIKFKPKAYGTISYKYNNFPVSYAIIRVYLKSTGKEMFHRVADQYGHYYCLLAKGDYYISIEKKNNDESYTPIYTSDVINVKRGIINQDFSI